MRSGLSRALAVALLGLCACSASSGGSAGGSPDAGPSASIVAGLDIPTDKGVVHGKTAAGVRSFLGIPFAGSTGGTNRWKPPQPVTAWMGKRDTTAFGPICPQVNPSTMTYDPTSSEDCLSLNVWTPDPAPAEPLPVMVWVFGGAYKFGSGGATPYGGAALVPKGKVVVVTLNYRVGALGFLGHSALASEDASGSTGNYGILDQRAALEWVRTNIAAFGGDKNNVTLFGESAGGNSVCVHLLSAGSRGLFHKAIVESGLCLKPAPTLAAAEATGDRFAAAMGCTDAPTALSCLRALGPDTLTNGPPNTAMQPGGLFYQDASTGYFFQPVVDGQVLSDQPLNLLEAKKVAPVPVLHGTNTAEGALFHTGVFGDTPVASEADYEAALDWRFGSSGSAVLMQYPAASFASPNDALTQVTTDAIFVCQARAMARLLASAGSKNYLYSFSGTLSGTPVQALSGKAFHSAELPYVFGAPYLLGSVPPASKALAETMEGYWTRFATTGDPNGGSAVAWPEYATASDQNITLDQTVAAASALEKARCDFWDTIPIQPL